MIEWLNASPYHLAYACVVVVLLISVPFIVHLNQHRKGKRDDIFY